MNYLKELILLKTFSGLPSVHQRCQIATKTRLLMNTISHAPSRHAGLGKVSFKFYFQIFFSDFSFELMMLRDNALWDHQIDYRLFLRWSGMSGPNIVPFHPKISNQILQTKSFKIQSFQIVDIFQTGLKYWWQRQVDRSQSRSVRQHECIV